MAAAVLKEMLIVDTLEIFMVSTGDRRVDHLTIVDSVLLGPVLRPGIGKYALGKVLFDQFGTHLVLACEKVASSHIVTG